MIEAERLYKDGAAKKEYVLNMIRQASPKLNYTLTEDDYISIGTMIDELVAMTKNINVPSNTK